MRYSQDESTMTAQRMYIQKLNLVLVQILKQVGEIRTFNFSGGSLFDNYDCDPGMAAQLAAVCE